MKLIFRIALLCVTLVVCAVLGSIAFTNIYLLKVKQSVKNLADTGKQVDGEFPIFVRYHPLLGHIGIPSQKAVLMGKEVTQNAAGYRDQARTVAKPAGVQRIALIGDSQAWGFSMGDNETISVLLEQKLNAAPGNKTRYEVLNFGVLGYSSLQIYLHYFSHVQPYAPDMVVWLNFQNDRTNNMRPAEYGLHRPVLNKPGSPGCLAGVPVARVPGFFGTECMSTVISSRRYTKLPVFDGSMAFCILEERAFDAGAEAIINKTLSARIGIKRCGNGDTKASVADGATTVSDLNIMLAEQLAEKRTPFLSVVLPIQHLYNKGAAQIVLTTDQKTDGKLPWADHVRITNTLQGSGIPFLNLHDLYLAHEIPYDDMFFDANADMHLRDDHVNEKGSAHIAQSLFKTISALRLGQKN